MAAKKLSAEQVTAFESQAYSPRQIAVLREAESELMPAKRRLLFAGQGRFSTRMYQRRFEELDSASRRWAPTIEKVMKAFGRIGEVAVGELI